MVDNLKKLNPNPNNQPTTDANKKTVEKKGTHEKQKSGTQPKPPSTSLSNFDKTSKYV